MNSNLITEIKKTARENIWQAISSLKEQYKPYVYLNSRLDEEKTQEVGDLIVFLEGVIPSRDYIPYIKDLIDEFSEGIVPGIVLLTSDRRKGLIASLPFEIRYSLMKKLKNKLPIEELKEVASSSTDNFFGFKEFNKYRNSGVFSVDEKMREALRDTIENTLIELKEVEKELTQYYDDIINKFEEEQKYYQEHKKMHPRVLEKMKKFEFERKNKGKVKIPRFTKAKEEVVKEKQPAVISSASNESKESIIQGKPQSIPEKEVIRYRENLKNIPKEKGIKVEDISVPMEKESVVSGTGNIEVSQGDKKTQLVDIKPEKKEEAVKQPESTSKTHYDQSEVIKKIKEQQKGKSSIDSKVE